MGLEMSSDLWWVWLHSTIKNWLIINLIGDIFRFKPDGILINTGAAYRAIHGPRVNIGKTDFYIPFREQLDITNTLNTIDPKVHARKRRVLNTAFSEKTLRSAEPFIVKHVDRWCDLLLEDQTDGWTEPINISDQTSYLFFDIMADLSFGKSFDIKEPGARELRSVPETIHTYVEFMWKVFCSYTRWAKPQLK